MNAVEAWLQEFAVVRCLMGPARISTQACEAQQVIASRQPKMRTRCYSCPNAALEPIPEHFPQYGYCTACGRVLHAYGSTGRCKTCQHAAGRRRKAKEEQMDELVINDTEFIDFIRQYDDLPKQSAARRALKRQFAKRHHRTKTAVTDMIQRYRRSGTIAELPTIEPIPEPEPAPAVTVEDHLVPVHTITVEDAEEIPEPIEETVELLVTVTSTADVTGLMQAMRYFREIIDIRRHADTDGELKAAMLELLGRF